MAHTAIKDGVARIEEPEDMELYLSARMWNPSNPIEPAGSFHPEELPLAADLK